VLSTIPSALACLTKPNVPSPGWVMDIL
jgi:hypothetical protein